jgi:hypothetical protein
MSDSDGDPPRKKRTIVGGRPRGKDKPGAEIPRGVEFLLKMAAIDPTFRARLIHMRGTASQTIGFKLSFSEAMILEAVPEDQLQAMIDAMPVSDEERSTLLTLAPQSRLPADSPLLATLGIRPEWTEPPPRPPQTRGIRPDLPIKKPRPPRTKGIRPDDD